MEASDVEDGEAPLLPRSNNLCARTGACIGCTAPTARSPMLVVAAITVAFVAGCIAWGIASPSFYPPTCLPSGFVDASADIPALVLDMRYYSNHNFMGRRVQGYNAPMCVLTAAAAQALALVAQDAAVAGYALKVYDCYRPKQAVQDFVQWAGYDEDVVTKGEFYPTLNKTQLFPDYIALESGHSRGSTLDLTLVPSSVPVQAQYIPGQKLQPCFAPLGVRFGDNSIDMGCGFDCFHETAHTNANVSSSAHANRMLLLQLMQRRGFSNYDLEFWHFTLDDEPYPSTYFDFPIQRPCDASASREELQAAAVGR